MTTFELLDLSLLPDLDQAEVYQIIHSGPCNAAYCTYCNINWASVYTQDDSEKDESYDYCPKCKNGCFLGAEKEGEKFIMQLNGIIINAQTKELFNTYNPVVSEPLKPFDKEAWLKEKQEAENVETEAIAAYQASGIKEDYFKRFPKSDVIQKPTPAISLLKLKKI